MLTQLKTLLRVVVLGPQYFEGEFDSKSFEDNSANDND